ncbi:hypothetical protein D3C71_1937530 [compost metagenome]
MMSISDIHVMNRRKNSAMARPIALATETRAFSLASKDMSKDSKLMSVPSIANLYTSVEASRNSWSDISGLADTR